MQCQTCLAYNIQPKPRLEVCYFRFVVAQYTGIPVGGNWLGMEGSNLRFLIQSQASYHWTNPQQRGWNTAAEPGPPMATTQRAHAWTISWLILWY